MHEKKDQNICLRQLRKNNFIATSGKPSFQNDILDDASFIKDLGISESRFLYNLIQFFNTFKRLEQLNSGSFPLPLHRIKEELKRFIFSNIKASNKDMINSLTNSLVANQYLVEVEDDTSIRTLYRVGPMFDIALKNYIEDKNLSWELNYKI